MNGLRVALPRKQLQRWEAVPIPYVVTDAIACTSSQTATVTQPSTLSVQANSSGLQSVVLETIMEKLSGVSGGIQPIHSHGILQSVPMNRNIARSGKLYRYCNRQFRMLL